MHTCCKDLLYHSTNHCLVHSSPFLCPDWLIIYNEKREEFGIVVHDGGESYIRINYCPWCGKKLCKSKGGTPDKRILPHVRDISKDWTGTEKY